jgi:8-oxo-dGTP diphosphatase
MINSSVIDELLTAARADGVQQLVVGAIVREGDNVLLLKRPEDDFMGGIFELPSGKVEPGETLETALHREVAEETGLTVADVVEHIGSFDYTSGSGKKSRQYNFTVTVTATEPIKLTEHDSYLWTSLDGLLPVTDAVDEVLRKCQAPRAASQPDAVVEP